jgi:PilZ domain-containing protein
MAGEPTLNNETLDSLGVLTREQRVRLVNVSESGCLLETERPLGVGTVGKVHVRFGAEEYSDVIEVVRCHAIRGSGSTYHIGMRFLWTTRRCEGTFRQAIARGLSAQLAATNSLSCRPVGI